MAIKTETLIKDLARDIEPVRPLRSPWLRTLLWIAILIPYTALAIVIVRAALKLPWPAMDAQFLLEQAFAISTGIAAAMAAFASVIPGRSRGYLFWPLLPMLGWMATLSEACLRAVPDEVSLHHNLWCFPYIIILGTAPAIVLWMMLRRGAPLTPHWTAALGALAAAGLGNFCVRLVHPEDVTVMLLVWHIGGIFLLTVFISAIGPRFIHWRSISGYARVFRP